MLANLACGAPRMPLGRNYMFTDYALSQVRYTASYGGEYRDESTSFSLVPVDPALVVPYERAFQVPQQLGAQAQLVHAAIQAGIAGGALSGASAADQRYDLSRHWRNARTHASHDPVDWKYHHVGNYLLNQVRPPNHGQI